jgi:uncharacterized membrane protein
MDEVTTSFQLIIGTFEDETAAAKAVAQLGAGRGERRTTLPAAATIIKDAGGKLQISETADVGGTEGAIAGGLAGALLGSLLGRKGLLGAGLGAFAGHRLAATHDAGIPDPRLEAIGQSLEAASSAAVAVVAEPLAGEIKALLKGMGATVIAEAIAHDTDFGRQLSAGDYGRPMASLATQAERLLAEASAYVSGAAETAAGEVKEAAGQGIAASGEATAESEVAAAETIEEPE